MLESIRKWAWLIIAALILLAVFLGLRSCRADAQLAALQKVSEEKEAIAQSAREGLTNTIVKKNKEIDDLTKQISSILANAGKPTPGEIAKDKELADLRKSWANLSAECQVKLNELDKAWSDKFNLAEERHKTDLFNLNITSQKKFNAQIVITEATQKVLDSEIAAYEALKKTNAALEISYGRARLFGKVKTGLIIAAAGYVALNLIKK